MSKYYQVKAQFVGEPDKKGKSKKVSESYLVESISPTDAEARTVKYLKDAGETREYDIKSASESKIIDIILNKISLKNL